MVSDAPHGVLLCFSEQAPIHATALHSFDILRLTQFDSVLVEGSVAYSPPGAHPGLLLCLFLVLFSSFVPVHGSPCPLFCCPGRHSWARAGCRSPLECGSDLASAGLVAVLSLFSCLSLSGHVVPSEASTGFSSGYGSCAVVEARASLWPVPDVVLWETIPSLVAAPSLGSLDLF